MEKIAKLIKNNKSILIGIIWVGLGSVVSSGSVYICSLIVSRNLGIDMYGKYGIIQANIYTFASIASAGLGITTTKFISQYRDSDILKCSDIIQTCRFISLISSVIFALIIFIAAPYYANNVLNDNSITLLLRIGVIYIAFTTMNSYQIGALVGFELFDKVAYVNLFQGIFNIITALICTYIFGITGAVAALSLSSFFIWICNYRILKKTYEKNNIILKSRKINLDKRLVYSFLIPATLCGLVSGIATWVSTNLIATLDDGYTQLAMYNAANNYKIIILYVPNLIGRVVLPNLSNFKGNSDISKYNKLVKVNFVINIVISCAIGIFIIINSHVLFKLYGKEFYNDNILMTIIIIGAVFDVITNLVFQILVVNNEMWSQLKVIILRYITLLMITFIFRGNIGSLALAIAYVMSTIVNLIYYLAYYIKLKTKKVKYD